MKPESMSFGNNYPLPKQGSSPLNFQGALPAEDNLSTNPYYQMELTRSQLDNVTNLYFLKNFKDSKFYQALQEMNIPEKDFKFSSLANEQQEELSWRLGLPKDLLADSDDIFSEYMTLQAKYKTELSILANAAENDFLLGKKYVIGASNDPGSGTSLSTIVNKPAPGKLISDDPFNVGLK